MTTATPAGIVTADPTPADVVYDDMTRAWRNEDYALAWHLATALLRHLAGGGAWLTAPRGWYYASRLHARYRPADVPDVRKEVTA